jgi:DNA-binding transcriptional ArsR family regulator
LRVLIILSQGEATVKSLTEKVGLTQLALSQHLAKLRKGKLVKTRRESQRIYYSCTSAAVLRVLEALDDIFKTPGIRSTSALRNRGRHRETYRRRPLV